jgi:hypothetical protein
VLSPSAYHNLAGLSGGFVLCSAGQEREGQHRPLAMPMLALMAAVGAGSRRVKSWVHSLNEW